MPIVLNTNASATEATFNLSKPMITCVKALPACHQVIASLSQWMTLAVWPLPISCNPV